MKILETPWEKRNLDVNGVEFYFEHSDCADHISYDVLNDKIHDYQIAYIPTNEMEIINLLSKHGFVFSETRFQLNSSLKHLELPSVFSRYEEQLSYHKVTSINELNEIYDAIKSGIFDTDKVALDPYFGQKKSGYRYAMWSQDIIENNLGIPYIVSFKDQNIGFFIIKIASERTGDSFLAALFDKEKSAGFGFSVLYYPMLEAKKMGLKAMIAGVSSNNLPSLTMHLALGYQIKNMNYVMIKHLDKEKENA